MYAYPSPIPPSPSLDTIRPAYASNGPSLSRFTPQSFKYNGRVAIALLPSLAALAIYGGSQVAAVLVVCLHPPAVHLFSSPRHSTPHTFTILPPRQQVGFMGAYILDGMRFKEGSFTAVWATMAVAHIALVYNALYIDNDIPTSQDLLALLMCALTLFLTGVWATLQFKWIQLQHPAVAVAFEKTLIVGCIPVGAGMHTWGVALSSGMDNTPFLLAFDICVLYYLFALPLQSSFSHSNYSGRRQQQQQQLGIGGGASASTPGPGPPPLQSRFDAISAFLLTSLLPAATYVAIHSATLFQSLVHFWSLCLLASGPLLFISSIKEGKGLWFLGRSGAADALRSVFVLVSLAGFLAGVEGRIVFHSFGQYIRLAAPYSYIAITLALYGVAALGLLYISGALGEEVAGVLAGPVAMVSASVGGLVMGLPVWVLPAPLIASAGLALFFDSRTLRDYLIFVVGAIATGVWFLWRHFWLLKDIDLDGLPLRTLCVLLAIAMVPAFLIPGLLYSGAKHGLVSIPLLLQAGLLCFIEERLFAGDHAAITYNVHPMFPAFLVVATSLAGLTVARRLAVQGSIGVVEAYFLQCAYGAKAAMLVVPEARLMVPVLGLALAATPPILVSGDAAPIPRSLSSSSTHGGMATSTSAHSLGSTPPYHRHSHHHHSQILPWQGLGLAAAVVLAVIAARYAMYDMLHLFLSRRPSEALATGALLVAIVLGCLPLVTRYYKSNAQVKRTLVLTAAAGLLLMLLRPPLPVSGGAECPRLPFGLCPRLWNERHAPQHEEDDISIYGDGLRRREHWPLWLLVGAAFAGLYAATSPAPFRHAAPLRLIEAAIAAVLVAAYMALEFFPSMPLVQMVVGASALLAAVIVVLIQVPSRGGTVIMPVLLMVWAASFVVALMARAISPLPRLPPEAHRLMPDYAEGVALEEERNLAVLSALLASYAVEALMLAFALKMRIAGLVSGALPAITGPPGFASVTAASMVDRAADFLGQCMPAYALHPGSAKHYLKGPASAAMQRLASNGLAWAPTACNIVTLLCFGLCIYLNTIFTGGDPWGFVLLSPVLLLLCEDPILLRGLTDHRRYFPPTLTAVLLLSGGVLLNIKAVASDPFFSWKSDDGRGVATTLALVSLCVPSLVELLRYMWSQHRVSPSRALLPAIVAAVGVFVSSVEAVQLLAGLSAVGGVYLASTAQQTRRAGHKMI